MHPQTSSAPPLQNLLRTTITMLEKTAAPIKGISRAGSFLLVVLVMLTFLDVFLRYFLGQPIAGSMELTGLGMSVIFFSGLAWAQLNSAHISMDVIVAKCSPAAQDRMACITWTWSFSILAFGVFTMARYALAMTSLTPVWHIPYTPFVLFGAFGLALLDLAVLRQLLERMLAILEKQGGATLAATLLFALLTTLLAIWFGTHKLPGMSTIALGCTGLVLMMALFLTGMPVAYVLLSIGFLFIANIRGLNAAFDLMGRTCFNSVSGYSWSPLMFFLLMGYICFYSRFGEDLYRAARTWMGHWRGGLATGSVCACTAFGAVVGDTLAGSIAMSAIALPEMRRSGYKDSLSVGTLACSGTIGALIPPSTTMIIYGVLAEQSIGDLFIAGVIPGFICMFCFIAVIAVRTRLDPQLAPPAPRASAEERHASLRTALPIILIFCVVIGGIYAGVFTATEGGGIGCATCLLLALALRRLTLKNFLTALDSSARFISMCFALILAGDLFGFFMTMSRIPMVFANSVAGLDMPPMVILWVIIFSLCFLGCFIPSLPLVLICIPIFLPLAKNFGWDLVWFGVVMTLVKNMAGITPPFGINLFVLKGVADVPLDVMYKAALPFVHSLFACIAIIVAFQQLSLLLPSLMG